MSGSDQVITAVIHDEGDLILEMIQRQEVSAEDTLEALVFFARLTKSMFDHVYAATGDENWNLVKQWEKFQLAREAEK